MNKLLVTYLVISTVLLVTMWQALQASATIPFMAAFGAHVVASVATVGAWWRAR